MERSRSQLMSVCMSGLFLVLVSIFFFQSAAAGTAGADSGGRQVHYLSLSVGRSIVVNSAQPVTRVSIANPETADFVLISPREIYVTGMAVGVTNMTLWGDEKVVATYNLSVTHDVEQLRSNVRVVLPDEKDVQVLASGDSITLFGNVANTASIPRIVALAEACAPKEKVNNLLEVAGSHQVMLEVRVSEISRALGRELGLNLYYTNDGTSFGVGMLDQLTKIVQADDGVIQSGPLGIALSDRINAMFRFNKGSATWTGFIDALSEDGIIKVLAEPNLIALSGQNASFLAGGEFPVPVPQGLGTAAIEWKTYGVLLNFTPVVLGNGKIHITVEPTVSEPDFTFQVVLEGSFIPSLKTRTVQTAVELSDGQSFAIAGLLSNESRSSVAKYPFLGDIPVLGQLFSSRAFQSKETELVVIVTPRLVKPVDQREQPLPLPTDSYKEPSDLEFFLWGKMEARESAKPVFTAELDGEFGHAVPPVETMPLDDIQDLPKK